MATTADIRTGLVIEHKGNRMRIVSFLHVKPGKGGAFVRTKLKNIITGQVIDETFRSGEKIIPIRIETQKMQYLYSQDNSHVQIEISNKIISDEIKFIKEGLNVDVDFIEEEVIGINPPLFVNLKVIKSDPGIKGNTATGATKPATLETGFTLNVPLFINENDILKIDSRTGEYIERVK